MNKAIRAAIAIFAVSLTLTGCTGNANKTPEVTTKIGEDMIEPKLPITDYADYNLDEYVTIGQYKGVEITKGSAEVTDEQLTEYIANVLQENTYERDVTDRVSQNGDVLVIDFTGKMDDMDTPEGLDGTDVKMSLGSGGYIPGFEDALVNRSVGDRFDMHITFPTPYSNNPDLAGQAATFDVTVKQISETVLPELTDEFVKTISDYATVDEYKSAIKLSLYNDNLNDVESDEEGQIWDAILATATVIKYPDKEIQGYIDSFEDYYNSYLSYYNVDSLETLVTEKLGMTMEDFNSEARKYAEQAVSEELVMFSIIKKEGISVTQTEYDASVKVYAQTYNYDTVEAFEEHYGKDVVLKSLLWEKLIYNLRQWAIIE